jgi:hypothetical protein
MHRTAEKFYQILFGLQRIFKKLPKCQRTKKTNLAFWQFGFFDF